MEMLSYHFIYNGGMFFGVSVSATKILNLQLLPFSFLSACCSAFLLVGF